MLQRRGRLDLAEKPLGAEHRGELGMQHLDGDLTPVPEVVREIHGRHAAGAELPLDAIAVGEGGAQARELAIHPAVPALGRAEFAAAASSGAASSPAGCARNPQLPSARSHAATSRSTRSRSASSSPHDASRNAGRASRGSASASSTSARTCAQFSGDGGAASPREALGGVIAQCLVQPRARHLPVTSHRALRHAEGLRSLHLGEAGKEAALDDARQSLVHATETLERLVEREQRIGALGNRDRGRIAVLEELERDRGAARAAASRRLMLAGVVDQDAAHRASRKSKELAAIDPLRARLFGEPQVRLVNHRGGGQRVTARLGRQLSMRDALELAIDQRHETVHRLGSAAAQGGQRLGDLLLLVVGHFLRATRVASRHATTGVASFARFLRVSSCGITTAVRPKPTGEPLGGQHASWPLQL